MNSNILIKTAKEYYASGNDAHRAERYNAAVVLYFKALVALIDLHLLQQTQATPSSHTERFRVIQARFPDIYDILDRDFPFYQDSYIQLMSKELAEVIRNDARTLATKTHVTLD